MIRQTYTVQQVADILVTTCEIIIAKIRSGELVASNIGCGAERPRWRITDEDLAQYLLSNRLQAVPQAVKRRPKRVAAGKDYFADA